MTDDHARLVADDRERQAADSLTGQRRESARTDFVLIGWLDPRLGFKGRLHTRDCGCPEPLRSIVHREANHIFVREGFGSTLKEYDRESEES